MHCKEALRVLSLQRQMFFQFLPIVILKFQVDNNSLFDSNNPLAPS